MYLLRDCAICLEGYDAERSPCSITCGHIFCRTCLDSHMCDTQVPLCPLCRAPITRGSVRKIICEDHSGALPPTPNTSQLPPTEDVLWKVMKNAIENRAGREQRKVFVQSCATENARRQGVSENFAVAFNAVRMLVGEEYSNKETQRELQRARTAEARWHERATALEGELDNLKTQSSAITQEAESLRSKIQTLQATFQMIHDLTSSPKSPATFPSPISAQPRPNVHIPAETEFDRIAPSPDTDTESSPEDQQQRQADDPLGFWQRATSTRIPTPESPSPFRPRPFLPHMSSPRNRPLASPRSFFNLNPTTSYSPGRRSSNSSMPAPPQLSLPSSSEFSFNLGVRP